MALVVISVLGVQAADVCAQGVFNLASLKGIYVFTAEDRGGVAPAPGFGAVLFDGAGKIAGGFITMNMVNPASPPDRMTMTAMVTGGSYTVDHPVGGMGRATVIINGGPMGVFNMKMHYIITAATDTPVRLANEIFGVEDGIDPFSGGVGVLTGKRR